MTVTPRHVVVVGGGLAGITAAIRLRDAGAQVTLIESRPRLGGAATSYTRAGMTIDNGQHVFLKCCDYYTELLARLGVSDKVTVQDRFDVTVLGGDRPARLRRSNLPSPLHLARALMSYPLLSLAERAVVGRAALAFRFANPASARLDAQRLGDWLAARGQSEQARRRLWDLFVISSLNIAGDEASTALAAKVIKTALLGHRDAADIGMASVPLGELHEQATTRLLDRLGARIRLGARAAGIERLDGGGFRVRLARSEDPDPDRSAAGQTGGEPDGELLADAVILAVPAQQAGRLAGSAGVPLQGWESLGASPILNVHVIYDRKVTDLRFAAAIDSPVQWVFDKTRQSGLSDGQYLAVSVSAADEYIDVPAAAIGEQFLPALARLFPAAADAGVRDFFVTRERRATFRQGPGTGSLRPGAATSVPGLVLAGAWTDTGWPDTMEGAVRSGHNAAQELTRQLPALATAVRASAVRASAVRATAGATGLDSARLGASS